MHPKCLTDLRHLTSQFTKSIESKGFSLQTQTKASMPTTLLHGLTFVGQVSGQSQNQSPGQFCRGISQHSSPANSNALSFSSVHINTEVPHTGGNKELEFRQLLQNFRWKPCAFPHRHNHSKFPECRNRFLCIRKRLLENLNIRITSQLLPIRQPKRYVEVIVKNRNFHNPESDLLVLINIDFRKMGDVFRKKTLSSANQCCFWRNDLMDRIGDP